jgi:tape measure domain-containing protein
MAEEVYRIEIPVTVEDRSEPALSGAEKKVSRFDQTVARTRKQLDGMNRSRWQLAIFALDRASSVIRQVGSYARQVAGGSYRITVRVLDFATRPLRSLGRMATSTLGLLGAGAGIGGGIIWPIKLADDLETASIGFETMLGSAKKSEEFMKQVQDFAIATPFSQSDVIQQAQGLLVRGFQQDEIIPMLTKIGNVTAAFGTGSFGIERIVTALGQMRSAGRVTAEDMNQLTDAGVQAWKYLADGLGLTIAQVRDLSQKGLLPADKSIQLILKGMSQFDGMMEKTASKTARGLASQILDTFNVNIFTRWGRGLQESLLTRLDKVNGFFGKNQDKVKQWGDVLQRTSREASDWILRKFEVAFGYVQKKYLDNPDFQQLDFSGKVRFIFDDLNNLFSEWWNSKGQAQVENLSAKIGGALGGGIGGFIMTALGAADPGAKVSESPFIQAGGSAGHAFLEAFLEAFDAGKIAEKAKDAFLNLQPTWLGGETSSGVGQALALMMDAWLLTKVGRILKGPAMVVGGMSKGARTATRWLRGGSAAETSAEPAAAAEMVKRATSTAETPWYHRLLGRKAVAAAPEAPIVSAMDMAQSTGHLKDAAASYRDAVTKAKEAENAIRAAEVARTANQAQLNDAVKQYKQLQKQSLDAAGLYRKAGIKPPPGLDKKVEVARKAVEAARGKVIGSSQEVSKLSAEAEVQQSNVQRARDQFKAARPPALHEVVNHAIPETPKSSWWSKWFGRSTAPSASGIIETGIGGSQAGGTLMRGLGRGAGKLLLPLSLAMDAYGIAEAAPGKERNQAIGGAVGGWGGFAAGAAGGAAIGSVVPGVGTAIGGLIGGILGSIGGGAVGEWIGSKGEDISRWFDSTLWPSLQDGASATWTWISDTGPQSIAKGVGYAVGYIGSTLFNGDWWSGKWGDVEAWSDASWENSKQTWNNTLAAIDSTLFNGEWWNDNWSDVETWASDSWTRASEIWNNAREAIGSTLFDGDWWTTKWKNVESWASGAWENIKGKWGSFWDKVGGAFQEGEAAGQAAAGSKKYARGGLITRPHMGLVGEAGPEAIIPLSAGMRDRGRDLWEQVGQRLGVHPLARFSSGQDAGEQAGARAYARGGLITRPHLGLIGEAGPEAIIPLSARMRGRGRELWEQAGQMLGVRPFALGGIVGNPLTPSFAAATPSFTSVAPFAQARGGMTINLGGVQFSINVEGDGEGVIEAIRQHGDEIADEIAEKIGLRLESSTNNSV